MSINSLKIDIKVWPDDKLLSLYNTLIIYIMQYLYQTDFESNYAFGFDRGIGIGTYTYTRAFVWTRPLSAPTYEKANAWVRWYVPCNKRRTVKRVCVRDVTVMAKPVSMVNRRANYSSYITCRVLITRNATTSLHVRNRYWQFGGHALQVLGTQWIRDMVFRQSVLCVISVRII